MSLLPPPGRARSLTLLFLIAAPLAYGALSLVMGQDSNWDLRNYHWYNAYAYVNDRFNFDILPAQTPTFYNPVMDVPFFWLATHLPARAVGFILGVVQGLNVVLLYLLASACLALKNPRARAALAVMTAVVGILGGGTLAELGTTFYDNVLSLGILGSGLVLVLALPAFHAPKLLPALARVAVAGLLVGLAAGFKQTALLYCAGLGFSVFFVKVSWERRFCLAVAFGFSAVIGILIPASGWALHLYQAYGNPLFPYFNDLFKSPFADARSFHDVQFLPNTFWQRLILPWTFTLYPQSVGEIDWRDLAIPLLYVLLPVSVLISLLKRIRRPAAAATMQTPALIHEEAARVVLAAIAVSYLVWLKMFTIYRYAVPLEMLAPLGLVLVVLGLPGPARRRIASAVALLCVVQITTLPGDWGHVAWHQHYVEVGVPPLPQGTMVLMAGYHPIGFVATAFPPEMPLVRIQSNFHRQGAAPDRFTAEIHARIKAQDGPMVIVFARYERGEVNKAVAEYDLVINNASCQPLHNSLDVDFDLCAVTHKDPAPAKAPQTP